MTYPVIRPSQYRSDARRWILKQYIIARRQGNTPLQAMLGVWQEADAMKPQNDSQLAEKEWRKAYSRRYFMAIAQKIKHNNHWMAKCLTTSSK